LTSVTSSPPTSAAAPTNIPPCIRESWSRRDNRASPRHRSGTPRPLSRRSRPAGRHRDVNRCATRRRNWAGGDVSRGS
jgi:hypothetical protein